LPGKDVKEVFSLGRAAPYVTEPIPSLGPGAISEKQAGSVPWYFGFLPDAYRQWNFQVDALIAKERQAG
jgi:hypothetical protein